MFRFLRSPISGVVAIAAVFVFGLVCASVDQPSRSSQAAAAETAPANEYTGAKRCSSCHFKEYMSWKKTGHAKAFTEMPAKYAANADCLKCHITAYGVPGGYKGPSTPDLLNVTCEACHGPGSAHEAAAKPFLNKKELTADEKKIVNAPIQRKILGICNDCHMVQSGHKDHPKFDKK
jgi:hypothetical protein